MKLLVTGGAGFIGSAVIRHALSDSDWRVINVDKLTYAANLGSLAGAERNPRYNFHQLDICDGPALLSLLTAERPDAIMHLAAESHVDRSIEGPAEFIRTNLVGTFRLLESAHAYWRSLTGAAREKFRFHHVSTDEVFGSLGAKGQFREDTAYSPNSPYSASKAGSDHLVRAWFHTFGLPTIITNCSNNYGPYQFPEKLIPHMIVRALAGQSLPVYGKGENVRDWLYVEDHARALVLALTSGRPGETYNIGGNNEWKNIDLVQTLCGLLDEALPEAAPHKRMIEFVTDRPGHDARYAIDTTKIKTELGWQPRENFETGLRRTLHWYLENRHWWQAILSGAYQAERLGLIAKEKSS